MRGEHKEKPSASSPAADSLSSFCTSKSGGKPALLRKTATFEQEEMAGSSRQSRATLMVVISAAERRAVPDLTRPDLT